MIIFENIKLALSAIKANKMRSILTMLGMIIGISSVIAIVSLGDTMRGVFASEYENVGLGLAYMYIMTEDGYYTEKETFTLDDEEKIRDFMGDDLVYVGYGSGDRSEIKIGRKTEKVYINALATNPMAYQKVSITHGRMFSDQDIIKERPYTVIEDKTALALFGREDAVGETIKVKINQEEQELLVVGIYHNTDSALMKLMGGSGGMSTIYVPESLYVTADTWNWTMYVVAADGVDFSSFQNRLLSYVARLKGVDPNMIRFYSAQEEMGSVDTMLSSLSMVVGAIAAISLLVGGIGIMNIMLVSVTERTREIGIRKALGAQTSDVLVQFLVESALISAAGGLIGTILGLVVVGIGASVVGLSVAVNPATIVLAVAFSAVVGICFGLYPASKAAKADPIVALRYE